MIDRKDFQSKQIIFLFSNEGDKLSFRNDNIVIKDREGKIKHQSTCYRLFLICVVGNISITSGLIQRAKRFGFSICLMTNSLKVYAVFGNRMEGNTELRARQYRYNCNGLGCMLIQNKILNQKNTLIKIRNRPQSTSEVIDRLESYVDKLNHKDLDVMQMMGIEGAASRVYFPEVFMNTKWVGRKPRIKHDYVNSTLDIGYTILFNYIDALLGLFGFDQFCGVLHKSFYMRKSLVCDLMEPMRPLMDYQIRKSISLGQCKEEDFEIVQYRYLLKWKKNNEYISFMLQPIMQNKDAIYKYVQGYYRSFMKGKEAVDFPRFLEA